MAKRIIDLDDGRNDDLVVVVHVKGVRVPIGKTRLMELIENEQEYLRVASGGQAAAAPAADVDDAAADAAGRVTHGSLSHRIRKIYLQCSSLRALRPAHGTMLVDLIEHFDWVIPDHPNTRLEVQLMEMMAWPNTDSSLKLAVGKFLERYLEARRRPAKAAK
jgi:hypothetical protein